MPMSITVASDVPSVSIFLEVCIEKRAREIHHERLIIYGCLGDTVIPKVLSNHACQS